MKTSFKIAALALILGFFAHQSQAQEILTGFQSGQARPIDKNRQKSGSDFAVF